MRRFGRMVFLFLLLAFVSAVGLTARLMHEPAGEADESQRPRHAA